MTKETKVIVRLPFSYKSYGKTYAPGLPVVVSEREARRLAASYTGVRITRPAGETGSGDRG